MAWPAAARPDGAPEEVSRVAGGRLATPCVDGEDLAGEAIDHGADPDLEDAHEADHVSKIGEKDVIGPLGSDAGAADLALGKAYGLPAAARRPLAQDPLDTGAGRLEAQLCEDPGNPSGAPCPLLAFDALLWTAGEASVEVALGKLGLDPEIVEALRFAASTGLRIKGAVNLAKLGALREEYTSKVKDLASLKDRLLGSNASKEEMARQLNGARNKLRGDYQQMTPENLKEVIQARNHNVYGDPVGPSVEWLRGQGKSWDGIIEGAMKPGF